MKRILGALAAALAIAVLIVLPARPAAAEPVADETQFLAMLNQLRAEKGLAPVAPDVQLQTIARQWSARMVQDNGLSHNPSLPNQVTNWKMIGENVGVGGTVAQLHQAFVNSPHHYENMVEAAFNFVGIGVVEAGGQIWVTVDFKQSKSSTSVPATAPAPTPPRNAAPKPAPKAAAAPKPAAAPAAPKRGAAPAKVAAQPNGAAAPAAPAAAVPTTAAPAVAGQAFNRPAPPAGTPTDASPIGANTGFGLVAAALLIVVVRGLVRSRAS
jgi:hypothetical protein